jgi:fumarate reductase subunit D
MAKSNEPIIWGTFAAGGTVAAFVIPVLILLTLLAALGHAPDILSYARLHAIAAHWFGKLVIFAVIALSLWGAAHRLRLTFFDFGARADTLIATVAYVVAGLGTIGTIMYLLRI